MWSQNVPLSASMIEEKAANFAKEWTTFRLQMAGYDAGRKEIIYHSRLFLGSRNLPHQRWLMRVVRNVPSNSIVKLWLERHLQRRWLWTFLSLPFKWNLPAEVRKVIRGMAARNPMGNKLPMFVIGKAKNPRCFKNVKFLPCCYRNQWNSWMGNCLKSGSESWTGSLLWKEEILLLWYTIAQLISYWQPKSNQVVFPNT